jgi:hypothetical protein
MSYANKAINNLQLHGYSVEVSLEVSISRDPRLLPKGYAAEEGEDTLLVRTLSSNETIPDNLVVPVDVKHVLIGAKIEGIPKNFENGGHVFIYPDCSFDFNDNPTAEMFNLLLKAGYRFRRISGEKRKQQS